MQGTAASREDAVGSSASAVEQATAGASPKVAKRRESALARLYPELSAGGFVRSNQRLQFFSRVNALLSPDAEVLDFGAGRGKWAEKEQGYLRQLCHLRGRCRRLVGADVDPVVLSNPDLDEAVVIEPGKKLPFADGRFDLIYAWAVFEHIEEPTFFADELARVLKPGGWLCAWTPYKWGYVSLGGRLVPSRLHRRVLQVVTPDRQEADTFPTFYRLNSFSAVRRYFPESRFSHHSYLSVSPPAYDANIVLLARFWQLWERLLPPRSMHIFLQKRA